MLSRHFLLSLLLFSWLCRAAAGGMSGNGLPEYDGGSLGWVFGRPLARRLRVGILAPESARREGLELARRLDCEVVPLPLRSGLDADLDVLVIGRVEWGALGGGLNREIIERTRAGMGLVYLCPPGKRLSVDHPLFQPLPVPVPAFAGTGFAGLPGFATVGDNAAFLRQALQAYSLGEGRLLVVDYGQTAPSDRHCLTPPSRRWRGGYAHYDLQLAFVGKAIRWAAAACPALQMADIEVPGRVAWGAPARLRLRLAGEVPPGLEVEWSVRRLQPSAWDPASFSRAIPEVDEEGRAALDLPTHLPDGEYEALVVLRVGGRVLDWGSARFRIQVPVGIAELSLPERSLGRMAASLPVALRFEGESALVAAVRFDVHDRHGRLVGHRELAAPGEGVRTDVSCAFTQSAYNRLTATAFSVEGLPLLAREAEFILPRPREPGQFHCVMGEDGGGDYMGARLRREAAALGLDGAVVQLGPAAARSLSAPEQETVVERLMDLARAGLAPVATVFAGSGGMVGDSPWLEERLLLLRPFSPLGILLDGFDGPPTAPFPDEIRGRVERGLPGVPAGLMAPPTAPDWETVGNENRLLVLPPEREAERHLLRAFRQPGDRRGAWFGDHRADRDDGWQLWRMVFAGMDSAWLSVDHAPPDRWLAVGREMSRLQAGVGRLLLSAERDAGSVALVYSAASVLQSGRDPSYGNHLAALAAMAQLLADAGFSCRVIPAADLADGEALLSRHRVVALPACIALPEGAATGLRQVVAGGGVVLADWGTGRYDENGRRREPGLFLDLFGMQTATGRPLVHPSGGIPGMLARTVIDGGVRLREAWPGRLVEGVPVLIQAEGGGGLAVYLNSSLANYPDESGGGLPDWLGRTLAREGIPAPVRVRCRSGAPCRIETARWQRGEARVIGLLMPPWTGGGEVELTLPGDSHAYDLQSGRYLGRGGTAVLSLEPGVATLVSLEPERIRGVAFDRLKGAEFATPAYRITVRAGRRAAASDRLVHVRLFDPVGGLYPAGEMTLAAPVGSCEYDVPFGLAPPLPGRWRLEATDVATGVRDEVEFDMSPGK